MSDEEPGNAGTASDKLHPQERARLEQVTAFPFVALSLQTTGIHPSTGRILTVDALTYDASGTVGQEFHAVLNPDSNPGPRHQHGLDADVIAAGQLFSKLLKPLDRLIDGRTLVVHDSPFTWGFIVSEARRAMTATARANRARSRNHNRGRRRHKVGHVPQPVAIIDTLATAHRQGTVLVDARIAAVATATGLGTADFHANSAREIAREATRLTLELERAQSRREGGIVKQAPEDLRADRFGLQRSTVRVDAALAPRLHTNPGPLTRGGKLRKGMEFVVAPEVTMDPDELITAGVSAELNYVEKLSRETSVVVCNQLPHGVQSTDSSGLSGKAMHAHRKGIPLVSDVEFLRLLEDVEEPVPAPAARTPARRSTPHVPNANGQRSRRGSSTGGGGNRRRRSSSRRGANRRRGDKPRAS